MADPRQMLKQSQKRQEWAGVDPVTLVEAARQTIYSDIQQQSPEIIGPLAEVVSRFEQQTRASLGGSTQFTTSQSSSA